MKQDIKRQLEKSQEKIITELEKGKDIQVSYQKSKNRLHIKAIEVKRIT